MLLSSVIEGLEVVRAEGYVNIDIRKIAYDSRKVEPGAVFICIKGFKADGHDYIKEALRAGAVALITERETYVDGVPVIVVKDTRKALARAAANFYGNPSKKFKLIGVTGTNGKTTTTYLIKSILEVYGKKVGLVGTIQNMIGSKAFEAKMTTPESLELQELFCQMAQSGVDYVVMEVSSHSLSLHRVFGCEFDLAVFTNISHDHLDFHGDMENYLKAKAKLFDMAAAGVINIDDDGGRTIYKKSPNRYLSYSANGNADIYAADIDLGKDSVGFICHTPKGKMPVNFAMQGLFSVYNALCAVASCYALGVPLDAIAEGIANVKAVKGRAELVYSCDDYSIIIDYAHTPDSLSNIISTFSTYASGRVVTVFGCGGDRDKAKRPQMGRVAGDLSDFCIITSDNPRCENPSVIIDDILQGIKGTNCPYIVIENRYNAIRYAIENAQKGDIILLVGKGHETYQEINNVKNHFDEREIVMDIVHKGKEIISV